MSEPAIVSAADEGTTDITPTPPLTTAHATSLADFDEIEKQLGISEFMSPSVPGFSAVVKARYSDFVVHEVGLDGSIARLTNRDIPATREDISTKEDTKPKEPAESLSVTPTNDTADNWSTLQAQLTELIKDATVAEQVMTMLQAHNAKKKCDDKFVTLPALEKSLRKGVHDWVRQSLPWGRSDGLDGQIRIWHAQFEKEMPNYKSFGNTNKRGNDNRHSNNNKRQKKSWPEDRPDFLQFVLYKENIDTTTATKELSRKGSKARIGYAGMKDKRGITTQFCTMYRTEPEQIVGDRSHGGGNSKQKGFAVVQVGNFEYVSKEMRLGTLKGNRFDLVLRHVQTGNADGDAEDPASKELLLNAATAMKEHGFINYFGTQRFGKYQDTHLVSTLTGECCELTAWMPII